MPSSSAIHHDDAETDMRVIWAPHGDEKVSALSRPLSSVSTVMLLAASPAGENATFGAKRVKRGLDNKSLPM